MWLRHGGVYEGCVSTACVLSVWHVYVPFCAVAVLWRVLLCHAPTQQRLSQRENTVTCPLGVQRQL